MNTILEEAANQLSKTWRKFSVEEEYRVAWSNAYLSFMSWMEGGTWGGGGRGRKERREGRRDDRWRGRGWMEGGMVEKV